MTPQVIAHYRITAKLGAGGMGEVNRARGSPNGRELFYESPDPDSRIIVAEYTAKGDAFMAGKPNPWSDANILVLGGAWNSDISPDGKRLVVFPPPETKEGQDVPLRVTFALNFFDELRRRVPEGK